MGCGALTGRYSAVGMSDWTMPVAYFRSWWPGGIRGYGAGGLQCCRAPAGWRRA